MDRMAPARTMIGIPKEIGHERANAGLRSMGVGDPQFCDFYHVRFQLLQAANVTRLALVRSIQRFSGCAIYGDVRFPTYDLLFVGLAAEPVSQH